MCQDRIAIVQEAARQAEEERLALEQKIASEKEVAHRQDEIDNVEGLSKKERDSDKGKAAASCLMKEVKDAISEKRRIEARIAREKNEGDILHLVEMARILEAEQNKAEVRLAAYFANHVTQGAEEEISTPEKKRNAVQSEISSNTVLGFLGWVGRRITSIRKFKNMRCFSFEITFIRSAA